MLRNLNFKEIGLHKVRLPVYGFSTVKFTIVQYRTDTHTGSHLVAEYRMLRYFIS
jgi:hypothetical protein